MNYNSLVQTQACKTVPKSGFQPQLYQSHYALDGYVKTWWMKKNIYELSAAIKLNFYFNNPQFQTVLIPNPLLLQTLYHSFIFHHFLFIVSFYIYFWIQHSIHPLTVKLSFSPFQHSSFPPECPSGFLFISDPLQLTFHSITQFPSILLLAGFLGHTENYWQKVGSIQRP